MRLATRGVILLLFTATFVNAQEPASCETGLARFRSGDFAAAQDFLWECMESGSGNATHALYLALSYRPLKNYESGLTRTQKALKTFPDNLDLLYIAAYLHYRRNETKDSMILVSKAYRLAPNDWRIHQLFALNYISFDMLEAAKLSLQRAISLNPKNAELHYQLARLYFTLGSFVDSIEESKQALALRPDYAEVYHNLALSYEGNGNVDAAIQNFEQAVELNRKNKSNDEWPLIDFATYQRMGGKPDAALPLLEEALAINPRSSKANYEMGELLRDLKKYQDAKKFLRTSFDLDPCNARALYGLALVTRLTGDTPGSLRLMRQFKELEAANKEGEALNRKCRTAR